VVGLAAKNLAPVGASGYPNSYTYYGRATDRARLQPVWLERAFRGLSNGGGCGCSGPVSVDLSAKLFSSSI
jgi:hypothetical protein